ncbi:hypothetical protein ACWE42_11065 [Sutcliffiella cohnii]
MSDRYKLVCYDKDHFRVPLANAIGNEAADKFNLRYVYQDIQEALDRKEELESYIPLNSGYYILPIVFDNVESIEYKRLDRDMKEDIHQMEKMMFGEKGIGLIEALGVTPGKLAKHFEELELDRKRRLLIKNQDKVFKLLKENIGKGLSTEELKSMIDKLVFNEEE